MSCRTQVKRHCWVPRPPPRLVPYMYLEAVESRSEWAPFCQEICVTVGPSDKGDPYRMGPSEPTSTASTFFIVFIANSASWTCLGASGRLCRVHFHWGCSGCSFVHGVPTWSGWKRLEILPYTRRHLSQQKLRMSKLTGLAA